MTPHPCIELRGPDRAIHRRVRAGAGTYVWVDVLRQTRWAIIHTCRYTPTGPCRTISPQGPLAPTVHQIETK